MFHCRVCLVHRFPDMFPRSCRRPVVSPVARGGVKARFHYFGLSGMRSTAVVEVTRLFGRPYAAGGRRCKPYAVMIPPGYPNSSICIGRKYIPPILGSTFGYQSLSIGIRLLSGHDDCRISTFLFHSKVHDWGTNPPLILHHDFFIVLKL